ncbi:MAG TPA: replicative DNA helicase [Bryobacteraceae bacterium]
MNQSDLLFQKGLPSNPEAERYVLATVMLGHQPLENITAVLAPEDFSLEKHRKIFAAMMQLETEGMRVDRVTVAQELQNRGQLESVDGMTYLAYLTQDMPEIVNLDAYVSIIRDKATLRRAILAHHKAIQECLAATDPTPDILARAEATLAGLAAETRQASFRSPVDVVNRAGGIEAFLRPDKRRGIETPWSLLNRMLTGGGFTPGQMVVIGARPSIGKTALACQIADHAATHGTGVAFFTLEMPDDAILMRMAAARAQVDGLKVTQGRATEYEIDMLNEAFADLMDQSACKLWVDDTTGCTVPAMRAALRRLTARHLVGLVVIDYLQLVEVSGGSERRRYEQVSEISRGVKRLAREFNIPVLVLAQLNRESEKDARPPRLSDLRDSGSIEQDGDLILLPHRKDSKGYYSDVIGVDLIIAKQRNGPLGRVPLDFYRRFAKFVEPRVLAEARTA